LIQIVSSIRHFEVPTFMRKASIFVLPSLKEGMPFTLLEALACGRTVVGSDIAGINNVITHGENGFLVPAKDSGRLSKAISSLLEDPDLRKRLGRNARQAMVEKYDWNVIAGKMEKVYRDLLEGWVYRAKA
jgi:glycosyltransferase involved in cell wall biosynthesis